MKRTGTALSLLIGLSLLGSGLSYAENYKYEYVNKWSGDATEGDPITVHYLQGWNQDKVTVGTDGTSQVTIADYGGSNGGEATVLGKNIAFTGEFTTGGHPCRECRHREAIGSERQCCANAGTECRRNGKYGW